MGFLFEDYLIIWIVKLTCYIDHYNKIVMINVTRYVVVLPPTLIFNINYSISFVFTVVMNGKMNGEIWGKCQGIPGQSSALVALNSLQMDFQVNLSS